MSTDVFAFTIFYILISIGIVYPPQEFISAGITIPNLFSRYLGCEHEQFIQYHLRRSTVTLVVHSTLPVGYAFILYSRQYEEDTSIYFFLTWATLICSYLTVCLGYIWYKDNWKKHPIAKNLKKFSNRNEDWVSVAASINTEYRRVDKLCVQTNSVIQVIATDNWILKVTPYSIYCAHQSDTALIVCSSDTHDLSHQTRGEVQYINIEVKPTRANVDPFFIRLNALDFRDLQNKCTRPISILPTVTFHTTLLDRFIEAFKEQISQNAKYVYNGELETCIGCMQVQSNVKLQKLCVDEPTGSAEENCMRCYCHPRWCIDCMARWFATRQDESSPNTWLASKCTCPICRAKFCIYDVSLIES